ncbi:MAG: hypothetical protein ACLQM8_26160 [Limisphaerales bacterium]
MKRTLRCKLALAVASLSSLALTSPAQVLTFNTDDLTLGFRKTGNYQENYELVVDIGPGTNYVNLAPGATVPVPNFSMLQLSDSFSDLDNLQWSVLGVAYVISGGSLTPLPGYPPDTLWLTAPRTQSSVQSTPPADLSKNSQIKIRNVIEGILINAQTISLSLGASNQDNTVSLVREPVNDSGNLSTWVESQEYSSQSNLQDTWGQNVEVVTPGNFTNAVVNDFYEVCPIGYTDPNTGQTNGIASYLGSFQFNPDGSMTFTRASTNAPVTPPPAPRLSITRSGGTAAISFGTTNGAVYSLYYTNLAGLTQPVTNWAASAATITGNGQRMSFTDAATAPNRVYRVGAQ